MIYQTDKEIEVLRDECLLVNKMVESGDLEGDIAEVGVFEGGSAWIIREAIPGPKMHLYDTFTGLPDRMVEGVDPSHYYVGHMSMNKDAILAVGKIPFSVIHQGIFPETAEEGRFCFVHIDVDIYQSTKDALEFFYPRTNIGGSIIVHDYPAHPGVLKAVDEFMEGKGTQHLHKWRVWGKDPMIRSGFRQLIVRRRV
jgi:O-methyltransferase